MFQDERNKGSFVPALPPELEEAKRAGMMAANPVPESEDDDQEDIEVRLTDRVARLHEYHDNWKCLVNCSKCE